MDTDAALEDPGVAGEGGPGDKVGGGHLSGKVQGGGGECWGGGSCSLEFLAFCLLVSSSRSFSPSPSRS